MKRAAVIDMGTNTFHLIIADLSAEGIHLIYKTNVPVRLGEGRLNENIIIPAAFERGISTLKEFQETIKKHNATVVKATATSAVRSAANGREFVDAAALHAGISIEVISGDQEAAFIFEGVQATGVIKQRSLIMDIGGGSTEFIICDENGLLWKKSYNIGAARLMQAYFKSDPISAYDKLAIIDHISKELIDLKEACEIYQPGSLIGSAGAFETFAGLLNTELDIKVVAASALDLNAYKKLAARLITSTHEERVHMEGLIPLRVDMIVIAALLTNYIIEELGLNALYLSTYDLKMGVLHTLLKSNAPY